MFTYYSIDIAVFSKIRIFLLSFFVVFHLFNSVLLKFSVRVNCVLVDHCFVILIPQRGLLPLDKRFKRAVLYKPIQIELNVTMFLHIKPK